MANILPPVPRDCDYIEGSLRQIEAARLALHSPSLQRAQGSCPAMMRGEVQPAKPGRKCLSRTQMAEPYELSQDLLDKQMEVLSSRYGGISQANDAANTIQRAYRRYSMVKKFAAITSAVQKNTEHRLSRRYQGQQQQQHGPGAMLGHTQAGQPGTGAPQLQHRVRHVNSEEEAHRRQAWDATDGAPLRDAAFHHASCCVYNSTSKSSYAGLSKVAPIQDSDLSPALRQPMVVNSSSAIAYSQAQHPAYTSPHTTPHPSHHDCHTPHCPGRGPGPPWPVHTPHHHIGVRPGVQAEDDNHSDAEIQSFPIDYLPDRSALACTRLPGMAPPSRSLVSGRAVGPSHAHCANCGSGQALPSHHSHRGSVRQQQQHQTRRAPDVPKRTVSRLTSLDVGESSELYPRPPEHRVTVSAPHSRNSSTHSSPRVPGSSGGSQQAKQSPGQANKPRVAQPGIPSRPKDSPAFHSNYAVNEVIRKRHYRTGLNIFNKKPERGIQYLIGKGFLDNSAQAVARFLITRKGLSKQMIGEYLGNISNPFNQAVTQCFANEMDLGNMQIDVALRKFQTYFRMPGEAQKIERLMEVFSRRYCASNPEVASKLNSTDSVFIMAFAIILLNTDLHTPNLKPEKRMKPEDFIRNLRGIDEGCDVDVEMLNGVYERIRASEFRSGSDHVTQVMKVQQTIVSKCPNLAVPYRRLVCYCRLYEVLDPNKKDRPGQHQREVFLFNDILVITKIHSRRKNSVTYTFRNSHPLTGMIVSLFENAHYSHGITLSQRWDRKVVITLNARNDHDRSKFVEDLKESIAEMDEMEQLRIESELEKQQVIGGGRERGEHRDSGMGGEVDPDSKQRYGDSPHQNGSTPGGSNLKRGAINNSLLDLVTDSGSVLGYSLGLGAQDKPSRRGSVGSLDSGMSVSFQSGSAGSAGTVSQESSPQQLVVKTGTVHTHGLPNPRPRKLSAGQQSTNL